MSAVCGAASRCACLCVPWFPRQKGLSLLLFWHAVQGVNEVFGVLEIGQTAKSNEGL